MVISNVRSQMPVTIPSAALRQMTDAERARLVDAAFDWTQEALDNYLAVLDARLRVFEQRYELPSSQRRKSNQRAGRMEGSAAVSQPRAGTRSAKDGTRVATPDTVIHFPTRRSRSSCGGAGGDRELRASPPVRGAS